MRGPFQNGAFRRLFAGRVVTNVGDSLYFVAAMWLVYDLTNDPLYSGVAGFLTLAPSALQFLAGPLVDRWSIRRTLTGTQAIQAAVVLAVPAAHAAGALTAELILVVMPALALINQVVYPAQSAALPRLLDDDDLVAANSAFSIAYQGVDAVANALGGVLIAAIGGVALFAVDAVTFGVAALLFATVAVPPAATDSTPADDRSDAGSAVAADGGAPDANDEGYLAELASGGRFVWGTFLVWLIGGAVAVNFAGGMALAAMPAYADVLGTAALPGVLGDAGAYGLLMAGFAAGNFLGAVGSNAVADRPLGRIMVGGFLLSGGAWTGAILVGWLPVTALLLAVALVPAGVVNVQLVAVVQSGVPEELVGRVSAVLGSATGVSIPLGALAGGAAASAFGAETTMLLNGAALAALAVYVLAVPSLRRLPAAEDVELRGASS